MCESTYNDMNHVTLKMDWYGTYLTIGKAHYASRTFDFKNNVFPFKRLMVGEIKGEHYVLSDAWTQDELLELFEYVDTNLHGRWSIIQRSFMCERRMLNRVMFVFELEEDALLFKMYNC